MMISTQGKWQGESVFKESQASTQDHSMRNTYTNKVIDFKIANRKFGKKIVYKVRGCAG
jgi:hypothetical protein